MSPGAGDPEAVVGRAGLGDLAAQVADALGPAGPRRSGCDSTSPTPRGQRVPDTWNPEDVSAGYTQAVAMTGLATQRARAGRPAPSDPGREVGEAFVEALDDLGVEASLLPEKTWSTPAPATAQQLGAVDSATYREVLERALAVSDNALTENLVRQAAARCLPPDRAPG